MVVGTKIKSAGTKPIVVVTKKLGIREQIYGCGNKTMVVRTKIYVCRQKSIFF
jgi:hypothetical protein